MGFAAGDCQCVDLRDVDARKDIAKAVKAEVLITATVQPHEVKVVRATCC
jgi:hypothetical protein